MAHRLTAYTGVMQARVEEQRDSNDSPEPAAREQQQTARQRKEDSGEISLTAFRFKFPGLVSMTEGG